MLSMRICRWVNKDVAKFKYLIRCSSDLHQKIDATTKQDPKSADAPTLSQDELSSQMGPPFSEPICKIPAVDQSQSAINFLDSRPNAEMATHTQIFPKVVNMETDHVVKKTLSFDDVPGPTVLKYMARAWSYIPVVGTQLTASAFIFALSAGNNLQWSRNVKPFDKIFDHYGPVVRLHGPFGGNLVLLNRPEHMQTVYKQEGQFPVRSSLDCIEHYRKEHRKYPSPGPFIVCGKDWEKLRQKVDNPLQMSADNLHDKIEMACEELISRIYRIRNRQEEVPADFNTELKKWSLEAQCGVLFAKRCGFLDPHGTNFNTEQARLLDAIQGATEAIKTCETGLQMWKLYETTAWKSLVTNCDVIDTIISKHIRIAQNNLRVQKDKMDGKAVDISVQVQDLPFIEMLIMKENMQAEDILTVLLDMLLIGVNATSSAMGFLLYHLSKCQRAQRILYEEVIQVLPTTDTKLTIENVNKMQYLKACVIESLRLQPPIPVITRVLPTDISLHSYSIPKGTVILMANQVACLREENFEDVKKFSPERWLTPDVKDIHPFATIPFGHGPRSCMGRSIAERQLWMLTAKIIRNFKVDYHYGEIPAKVKLFSEPGRALKFRFAERDEATS